MYYSEELVEEIRMKNDIVDVISNYVRLQKKGGSYFGLCPFHNEKSPSFSVSRNKQMYHCFGCGVGGNVLTFIMEYENYNFVEALKFLADRVGVELPNVELSEEAKVKANLRSTVLEMNKLAAKYFYAQLKSESGGYAYQYLSDRGLSQETILQFGLGYSLKFGDDLYKYLKLKGYKDEIISKSGLVNVDERKGMYDKFWNRVMFPIMDVNNRVIGFGGRVMGDGKPKYLNSPETQVFDKSRNLYGLNRARTSRKPYYLVCEGYMDVIALHQAGFTNAVATLGTSLTSGHASLLKRYVSEVYLTYDSDDAGTKAALRAIPILKEAGISAKVIRMDPYKDPDEYIEKLGAQAFEECIGKARNGFMYSVEVLEKNYDLQTPEGKTDFYNEVAKKLLNFEEELERNNYIEAVANAYYINLESLHKLVKRMAVKIGLAKPIERPKQSRNQREGGAEDITLRSQKVLLTYLALDPNLFQVVARYISWKDFTTDLYQTVAKLLFEQYEKGEMNPAKIINYFTDEKEHREVANIFHTEIKDLSSPEEESKAMKETIIKVKQNSINAATKNLNPTDIEGLQKIMLDKRGLQELEKLHINMTIH